MSLCLRSLHSRKEDRYQIYNSIKKQDIINNKAQFTGNKQKDQLKRGYCSFGQWQSHFYRIYQQNYPLSHQDIFFSFILPHRTPAQFWFLLAYTVCLLGLRQFPPNEQIRPTGCQGASDRVSSRSLRKAYYTISSLFLFTFLHVYD